MSPFLLVEWARPLALITKNLIKIFLLFFSVVKVLGVNQNLSITFHYQTRGQTTHFNEVISDI